MAKRKSTFRWSDCPNFPTLCNKGRTSPTERQKEALTSNILTTRLVLLLELELMLEPLLLQLLLLDILLTIPFQVCIVLVVVLVMLLWVCGQSG